MDPTRYNKWANWSPLLDWLNMNIRFVADSFQFKSIYIIVIPGGKKTNDSLNNIFVTQSHWLGRFHALETEKNACRRDAINSRRSRPAFQIDIRKLCAGQPIQAGYEWYLEIFCGAIPLESHSITPPSVARTKVRFANYPLKFACIYTSIEMRLAHKDSQSSRSSRGICTISYQLARANYIWRLCARSQGNQVKDDTPASSHSHYNPATPKRPTAGMMCFFFVFS